MIGLFGFGLPRYEPPFAECFGVASNRAGSPWPSSWWGRLIRFFADPLLCPFPCSLCGCRLPGGCRVLRPAECFAADQHLVQDHSELARQRDTRFLVRAALFDPARPMSGWALSGWALSG